MTAGEPYEGPDPDLPDQDDLPSTDLDVAEHVHFGMAGSFPLRLAELFFAEDGLHIVEYSYITVMFGLGTKKHRREAEAMQAVYDHHGIDEVRLRGDKTVWLNYRAVDRIVFSRGGRFGRPKITVYATDGRSYAYRIHDEGGKETVEELLADVEAAATANDIAFDVESGMGFRPTENLHRFLS